jgi:DNA-directed RNA polymerase specialized sigma24 family protein
MAPVKRRVGLAPVMGSIDLAQSAAAGHGAREGEIARVVARVAPVVEQVIARACRTNRLLPEDADDVQASVMLRIVRRLQTDGIQDAEAYAATLTRNALYDLVRGRYPQWARTKNRLRFLLAHDPRFAIWSDAGVNVCGLASWKGQPQLADVAADALPAPPWRRRSPSEDLLCLMQQLGGPIELDELVPLLMRRWRVVESTAVEADPATFLAAAPNQLEQFERRELLEQLWREIALLQPLQRTALLLNLRDHQGGNALLLFLILEIAGLDALAAAAGMTTDELTSLWNDLPLDDLCIAGRLGVARQKVINLRKSARERLARRLS